MFLQSPVRARFASTLQKALALPASSICVEVAVAGKNRSASRPETRSWVKGIFPKKEWCILRRATSLPKGFKAMTYTHTVSIHTLIFCVSSSGKQEVHGMLSALAAEVMNLKEGFNAFFRDALSFCSIHS